MAAFCCVSVKQFSRHMLTAQRIGIYILCLLLLSYVAWHFETDFSGVFGPLGDSIGSGVTYAVVVVVGACLLCWAGCYCTGAIHDTRVDRAAATSIRTKRDATELKAFRKEARRKKARSNEGGNMFSMWKGRGSSGVAPEPQATGAWGGKDDVAKGSAEDFVFVRGNEHELV